MRCAYPPYIFRREQIYLGSWKSLAPWSRRPAKIRDLSPFPKTCMQHISDSMTATERRASIGLAGIYGLRMLGLFIILPVFALYAEHLPGGESHLLMGIALGAYGLTQAILQIPAGWLSDRYGRKPVIYISLILFAMGSFIAASADDIYWVIIGRVVQGAGALNAAVMALTADLTREEHRTKAMAMIGITIGITFSISMVLSPLLNSVIGVPASHPDVRATQLVGRDRRVAGILHRVQRAGSHAALDDQQDRAAGRQRHRDGRIQQRAVPRRVLRRGSGRRVDAIRRRQCRVRVRYRAAAAVVDRRIRHAASGSGAHQAVSFGGNDRRARRAIAAAARATAGRAGSDGGGSGKYRLPQGR